MKKNSVLVMLLIVLMCVSLVFSGCQKAGDNGDNNDTTTSATGGDSNKPEDKGPQFDDPNEQVAYAIEKTMTAMIDADGIASVLTEAVNGGKIIVEAAGMIENELYMDVLGNQYADILTIRYGGFYTDIAAYMHDGKLAVSSPLFFGDEVYGIDFNTLETDLENSELWAVLGTSYEEFKTEVGMNLDAALDTAVDVLEKYMDALPDGEAVIDCLKAIEVIREEGTVTINGESVKAVNVKYHVTSEDILALLNAVLDESEKTAEAMKEALADVLTDVDLDALMAEMDMDTVRQEMKDAFANVDLEGDLVVSINPDTQYIMNVAIDVAGTVEGEEGKIDMDLVLGVDPTNSDKYSLTMFAEADGERNGVTADVVFASEGSVDTTTLTINEVSGKDNTQLATLSLTYDNSDGTYVLDVEEGFTSINGVYLVTDDKVEFTVDSVSTTYEGETETQSINFRLCIEKISKSEMPDMPNMKNILKLTQDEWTDLISQFAPVEPDDGYYEDNYYEGITEPDYSFDDFAA